MKKAFINGVILSGKENMKPVKGKTILVDNDIIEDIVDDKLDFNGYEIIDLDGKYIMPGLINLHVHLPGSGIPKKKKTDTEKLVKLLTSNGLFRKLVEMMTYSNAKKQLLSGVTTLRSVGGVMNYDSIVRDKINAGKKIGPRIYASNMAISVPGGHMANSLAYACSSLDEVIKDTNEIVKDKPDLLKIMITGGVLDAKVKGEPGEVKMPAEYVKEACKIAHENGLQVAAHVESPKGVEIALENGVDTIEHGAKTNDKIIELFKRNNASVVTTLSPAIPYALFDPAISGANEVERYNGQVVLDGIIDCAKNCLANDIKVGLGTDTGCSYVTHYDMWREVYYFAKYLNVSNEFALYTATLGNAKVIKKDNEIGSIEKGKKADMIVSKDNPIESLIALKNLDMVIIGGHIINNPKIKKSDKVEFELSKVM